MVKKERRVDNTDGVAYSQAQFVEFYGETKGNKIWEAAGKRASPKAVAKVKAKATYKVKAKPEVVEEPFHLSYFGVMAKGLAPALIAELSERPWTATTFKDPATEWGGEKGLKATGKCPFGQVPLLEVPARGKAPAQNLGQATAICNYIARIAKRKSGLEGDNAGEYAMSQMLMAEGEDLYSGLQKNQTTVFVKEWGGSKATKEESQKWWSETAKAHIAHLEKLLGTTEGPAFTKAGTSAGEIYLFAMLHQMKLVKGDILNDAKGLLAWYDATKANASVAKVLNGESAGGEYKQYFMDH
jgi:glutathione S-transferase